MKNILITGGAGNIGSAFVSKLSDAGYFVVVADNLLTGSLNKIPKNDNVKFLKCDVNNYDEISAIFSNYQFEYVFHFAAMVGVERTLKNPLDVLKDIDGIRNVLQLCKEAGVKRVLYSSSSEVYGENSEIPQNEHTTPLNSRLPYAVVKNIGEVYFRAFYDQYGLEYNIFRFFNTYGPNQSEDFVVPRFVKSALKNEPLTVYGEGKQTRTFCYIDDNVDACLNILNKNLFVNDVVNIGNDTEMSVIELARKVIDVTKSKSEIIFMPALPKGDTARRCPDISKMKQAMNRPFIGVEEGIAKLVSFYAN